MNLLDDARAQVDCFVNLTYLALLFALASFLIAISDVNWSQMPAWQAFGPVGHHQAVVTAAAIAIAGLTYYWAATCVPTWGDLVRSAFDCYLPALTSQLGFEVPPTEAERREFWTEFSALITYQQPMKSERWSLVRDIASVNKDRAAAEALGGRERGSCGSENDDSSGPLSS